MLAWLIALAVGLLAAALHYLPLKTPTQLKRLGLGLVRTLAVTLVAALLLDAPLGRARPVPPWAFVDASLSMSRDNAALWKAAWDTARASSAESTWVFGDSVRHAGRGAADAPSDALTRAQPVVERTIAAGRPIILITDGEVQDSSALESAPSGSRIVVLPRPPVRDVAVSALDAPRAVVAGDSLTVRATLVSAGSGAAAGTVFLYVDRQEVGRMALDAMSPWSERQVELHAQAPAQAREGASGTLSVVVASAGDAERRNDTLTAAIDVARAAAAVFVSTSPDQDARFAIAVLRGTLALPTRGFLRVAPGTWRQEGTLAASSEAEVRQALRDAPVAILHGDTSIFGPPQNATVGPLALIVPPETEDGEWYVSSTPTSPLSGALAALPLDSLAPISAGPAAKGDWVAMEARRGREDTKRATITGRDAPRRIVTVTGSGFWRWRFRGGAGADAYAALWGGIFDWLAAERADKRGAVPEESSIRAGQPVRWRRGSSADSLVRVVLQSRRVPRQRSDTITLRFSSGVAVQETPALPPGVYDVTVPGGRTTLAVNASAELLPSRPRIASGRVGRRSSVDEARRSRSAPWMYVAVILLLCAEWILRRRAGLR